VDVSQLIGLVVAFMKKKKRSKRQGNDFINKGGVPEPLADTTANIPRALESHFGGVHSKGGWGSAKEGKDCVLERDFCPQTN